MKNKILGFLKEASGFVSGEDISRKLKISRAGVWKYIEELRRAGYQIEAVSHKGYQLLSPPDRLWEHELTFGLNTRVIGQKVQCFETVDTTMDMALNLALDGAEEGTVVLAEEQTKGKGRMGRQWRSPKGKGIYFSLILRPPMTPNDAARLTLLSAVVLRESIQNVCALCPGIKWPNDLLVGEKKLAGILTEMNADMDRIKFIVIGMGINVNTSLRYLPEKSTSIKHEIGHTVSRTLLTQEIFRTFEEEYFCAQKQGFVRVLEKWKKYSSTLNREIRIKDAGGKLRGKAVGIDQYGGLVIRTARGEMVKKMSGDVVYQ